MKLGEILLKKGLLTNYQLEEALKIQARDKTLLGKILVSENYIKKLQLQKTLAEKLGLEFVDLTAYEPDLDLINYKNKQDYFSLEVLPISCKNGVYTLAVTEVNEEVKSWAIAHFAAAKVNFVITTSFDILWSLQKIFAANDDENARLLLNKTTPQYSANQLFGKKTGLVITGAILSLILAILLLPSIGLILLGIVLNLACFLTVTYKFVVFIIGKLKKAGGKFLLKNKYTDFLEGRTPIYSILVPLFKEEKSVKRLIKALSAIDYPKSALDIKLVVEADDEITINAIKSAKPPQYMEIIKVPYSLPQTKPKACNYALNYVRGEFVTIYDAEDLPDEMQLRKALATFKKGDANLACVQAKLNYYNAEKNILTKWFALEYATWFEVMIKGLEGVKSAIPLGGTSNHIKVAVLKQIGGWDAFNVTEDADLGMRLAQNNYKTAVINSITMEEAPSTFWAWIKQRTRWLKGFVQTYFVHMRAPQALIKKTGIEGFATLQFLIGLPVLIYFLTPIWVGLSLVFGVPDFLVQLAVINFFYASITHLIMAFFAQRNLFGHHEVPVFSNVPIVAILTIPAYGMLNIFAAWRAVYQLITQPYYWDKTEHGIS